MTNTQNGLVGKLAEITEMSLVRYLGGDPSDETGLLEVDEVYLVIGTGIAEHKETGEEFPLVGIFVPEVGGQWAIVDILEDDMSNAHCFELVASLSDIT